MSTIKELAKKIQKEKDKLERREKKEALEKELFNLRHKRKLELLSKVKDTAVHIGKNAGAMIKKQSKKKKKKTRSPFDNIDFGY